MPKSAAGRFERATGALLALGAFGSGFLKRWGLLGLLGFRVQGLGFFGT